MKLHTKHDQLIPLRLIKKEIQHDILSQVGHTLTFLIMREIDYQVYEHICEPMATVTQVKNEIT